MKTKPPHTQVGVRENTYRRLKAAADKRGMTVSQLLSEIIEVALVDRGGN